MVSSPALPASLPLHKVLLVFERSFWEEAEGRRDFWGVCSRTASQRGEAFQFWNLTRMTGRPALLVLHAGRAARLAGDRATAEAAAISSTMRALHAIFGAEAVPKPIAAWAAC